MRNNRFLVNLCLHIIGLFFCIVPPALCTLFYFPLRKSAGGGAVLAGGCVLLLIICMIPAWKLALRLLRSPASYTVWLLLFLGFLLSSRIAEQMTVISFAGLIGNLVGAVFFKLSGRGGK